MSQPLDPIALDVSVWDGANDLFVRAWVRADGILLPYSPVVVPNIGNGQYFGIGAVSFPENTQHLSIVYEFFRDSAFTIRSRSHSNANDRYVLSTTPSAGNDPLLIAKLNQIMDLIISHDLNSQLVGEIVEAFSLDGYVQTDEVIGYVRGGENLIGYVADTNTLDGSIIANNLNGFFTV